MLCFMLHKNTEDLSHIDSIVKNLLKEISPSSIAAMFPHAMVLPSVATTVPDFCLDYTTLLLEKELKQLAQKYNLRFRPSNQYYGTITTNQLKEIEAVLGIWNSTTTIWVLAKEHSFQSITKEAGILFIEIHKGVYYALQNQNYKYGTLQVLTGYPYRSLGALQLFCILVGVLFTSGILLALLLNNSTDFPLVFRMSGSIVLLSSIACFLTAVVYGMNYDINFTEDAWQE